VRAGLHCSFKISRQMLPLLLIFGWKTFVVKATCNNIQKNGNTVSKIELQENKKFTHSMKLLRMLKQKVITNKAISKTDQRRMGNLSLVFRIRYQEIPNLMPWSTKCPQKQWLFALQRDITVSFFYSSALMTAHTDIRTTKNDTDFIFPGSKTPVSDI